MVPATYVIVGGSRGIGAATAAHLEARGNRVISVSRGRAAAGQWVEADVTSDAGIDAVVNAVGSDALDGFLYLGGTWENAAFTDAYRFSASPRAETRNVIAVNLIAPILLAQALSPALAKASKPRIVLMGALSGLANAATPEVANTAAKFGLQGAAEALALSLRAVGIAVSVINPGNIATEEVMDDINEGRFEAQRPIALADIMATIEYLLALGPDAVASQINLHQTKSV